MTNCGTCGNPVKPDKRGRPRGYCSTRCTPQRQRGFAKCRHLPPIYLECKQCGKKFVDSTSTGTPRKYCSVKCRTKLQNADRRRRHPERIRDWWDKHPGYAEKRAIELKRITFSHYGGAICSCCGEQEITFLTIDHVNGGGGRHRKELRAQNFYKWLAKSGYSSGFRVLCMNCNWATRYKKPCPHEKARSNVQAA